MNAVELVHFQFWTSSCGSAAQERLDSSLQFRRFERFRKVIVAAGFESLNLAVEFRSGSKHQNRRIHAAFAEMAANIKAVSGRQHHIQNDQIEWLRHGQFLGLEAVAGALNGIAIAL